MAESLDDGRYQNVQQLNLPDSHGASDELIDPWCDPCYDDCDRKIEAISFCPDCNSFFCKTCDNAHTKLHSISIKKHRLVRGSRMPKAHASKPINYSECSSHAGNGNIKDHFCLGHGEMLCSQCASSFHTKCIVKKISALCQDISSADIDSLTNDIKSIKEIVMKAVSSLDKNVKDINNKRQTMINNVSELRGKLIAKIDKLCLEMNTRITQMCQQQSSDQADNVLSFSQTIDAFDQLLADIEKASKYHLDENLFLRMQDLVEKSRQCSREIEESSQQVQTIDLSFSPDPDLLKLLATLNTIGDIKEDRVQLDLVCPLPVIAFPCLKQIKATQLSSVEVRYNGDKHACHIQRMAVTPDGFMLLADNENKKLKVISPDHKLFSYISLPSRPSAVSVIDSKTATVVTADKSLKLLDISDPSSISIIRSLDLGFNARDSAPYNDKLILIAKTHPRSVKLIDLYGKVLWSVPADQSEELIFDRPWSLVCNTMNGTSVVIVSDIGKNTLTVLDINTGTEIKTIKVPSKKPCDLTVDRFGNVYVCYNKTNEICIWSADTDLFTVILSKSDLRRDVFRIIYNEITDELFMSYVKTDTLDVFKICH